MTSAAADDGETRTDRSRVWHAAAIAGAGATYLGVQFGLADYLAPETCRWCEPLGFDASTRAALVWDNRAVAHQLSNGTGYVGVPVVALAGLTVLGSGHSWRRAVDDVTTVVETGLATSLLHHLVKYSVGRQRPRIRYETSQPGSNEDNVSFFSGHTSLAFSLAVGAGRVASLRGYRGSRSLLAGGLGLAAATGYLRIAADAHYLTDVATGAAVGSALGYFLPAVLSSNTLERHHVSIVPTQYGLSLAGRL